MEGGQEGIEEEEEGVGHRLGCGGRGRREG